MKNSYKILIGKHEEESSLLETKRKWWDKSKANFAKIGCEVMNWTGLAQENARCLRD
jgi:hypothetical protein